MFCFRLCVPGCVAFQHQLLILHRFRKARNVDTLHPALSSFSRVLEDLKTTSSGGCLPSISFYPFGSCFASPTPPQLGYHLLSEVIHFLPMFLTAVSLVTCAAVGRPWLWNLTRYTCGQWLENKDDADGGDDESEHEISQGTWRHMKVHKGWGWWWMVLLLTTQIAIRVAGLFVVAEEVGPDVEGKLHCGDVARGVHHVAHDDLDDQFEKNSLWLSHQTLSSFLI